MIRLGLLGASGRMGQMVQKVLENEFSDKAKLIATASKPGEVEALLDTDAIIDFSLPSGTQALIEKAFETNRFVPIAIGTTGFTDVQLNQLDQYSKEQSILRASNFSTGVLLTCEILKYASPFLKKMGYQPSIVETHHVHKKDKPSGTAKTFQEMVSPENPSEVPTDSIREGEVIGDHLVQFDGLADSIQIQHHAVDRTIFARGAIRAAIWLSKRRSSTAGILTMQDYLHEYVMGRGENV